MSVFSPKRDMRWPRTNENQRIARLQKQSLESWFHTGLVSPSLSLTCMTSFAELTFSNAMSFSKTQDAENQGKPDFTSKSSKLWRPELQKLCECDPLYPAFICLSQMGTALAQNQRYQGYPEFTSSP